jgi:double-strand break repair protein MRE11
MFYALTSLLLFQGMTSVALYGLGNIRDERLNRMFQVPFHLCSSQLCNDFLHWNNCLDNSNITCQPLLTIDIIFCITILQTPHSVQWMRPGTQDGESASDWFNILVLHQNR